VSVYLRVTSKTLHALLAETLSPFTQFRHYKSEDCPSFYYYYYYYYYCYDWHYYDYYYDLKKPEFGVHAQESYIFLYKKYVFYINT